MKIDMPVIARTQRKHGPDGNFSDIASRIRHRTPLVTYRTAQALETYLKLTAPQPPRMAWWYASVNPKTRQAVPPSEQYVRTGHLKDSIVKMKFGDNEWYVVVGASYGKFVENGTRYMPAQPFHRNAVKYVRKHVLPDLVKSLVKR